MACSICNGTGWRPVGGDAAERVERCSCWTDGLTARLVDDARIPPRYARCSLDNFVVYPNEKLAAALGKAKQFADAFPAVDKGLCLVGPPGIGKSHIAAAILKRVIARSHARALFYEVPDLLRLIRSTFNPVSKTAELDIVQPVMDAELLVLDDLGKERPTEWVEETMSLIVSTRYNQKRITIFTTNFQAVEDDSDLDSLKVRVGFRLYSRLFEMCEFLEYDGADYRFLPPNGGPADLVALWKHAPARQTLPARTRGPARAELRTERRDLKWPGGKAGRT